MAARNGVTKTASSVLRMMTESRPSLTATPSI